MKNSIIISTLILMFVCLGCDKDEEILIKNTLLYKVKVQDAGNQLKKVTFYTSTYYPIEDETSVYGDGKSKNRELSDVRYLNTFDSIFYSPDILVYKGCTYYMEVTFHFIDTLNSLPKTYLLQDTITDNNNVTFVWPTDTVL